MGTEPRVARARARPCPLAGRSPRASRPRLTACPRRFAGHRSATGGLVGDTLAPTACSRARATPSESSVMAAGCPCFACGRREGGRAGAANLGFAPPASSVRFRTGLRPSGGRMPVFRVSQASPCFACLKPARVSRVAAGQAAGQARRTLASPRLPQASGSGRACARRAQGCPCFACGRREGGGAGAANLGFAPPASSENGQDARVSREL